MDGGTARCGKACTRSSMTRDTLPHKVKRMCLCHGVVHSSASGAYGRSCFPYVVRVLDVRPFAGFPALWCSTVGAHACGARREYDKNIARILLVNPLQRSRSTFSWGSFPSFCAFQEGMLGTPISVRGG